jgi:hypothetical protein
MASSARPGYEPSTVVQLYAPTHVLKPLCDDIRIVDGGVAWMKLGIGHLRSG